MAKAEGRRYEREWARNNSRYNRQLGRLKGRLDATSFRFFTDVSMHDGRVITLTVRDESGAQLGRGERPLSRPDPVEVIIEAVPYVSLGYTPPVYVVRYRGVRRLVLDHPSDQPLFHHEPNGLGDWGYDELTCAGRNHLRHEILFASGGTVSVECKSITVRKRKA
jgi:hypothetical protein